MLELIDQNPLNFLVMSGLQLFLLYQIAQMSDLVREEKEVYDQYCINLEVINRRCRQRGGQPKLARLRERAQIMHGQSSLKGIRGTLAQLDHLQRVK